MGTMTTPRNATEARKLAAIEVLHANVMRDTKGRITSDRESVCRAIHAMSPAVNSIKWRNAVDDYRVLVSDTSHDLTWAYYQGGIWFGNATL